MHHNLRPVTNLSLIWNHSAENLDSSAQICGRVIDVDADAKSIILQDMHGRVDVILSTCAQPPKIGDLVSASCTVNGINRTITAHEVLVLTLSRHFDRDAEPHQPREFALIHNLETRNALKRRARVVKLIRKHLDEKGFLEVETPILTRYPNIAPTSQLVTQSGKTGLSFHLRTCPEEHLKRMVASGFDMIYEIGKSFRDELPTDQHLPEFSMLECYQAYADYEDMAKLTEELFENIAIDILGTTRLPFRGGDFDVKAPWNRVTVNDAIWRFTGIDLDKADTYEKLCTEMQARKLVVSGTRLRRELVNRLIETSIEPHLHEPTFLLDHPRETICVAKTKDDAPHLLERFEAYIAGIEVANAYSELTNYDEQRERMETVLKEKIAQDMDEHPLDADFLEALRIGLPPTAGLGIGIDRLVMLFTNSSIREVVAFPTHYVDNTPR